MSTRLEYSQACLIAASIRPNQSLPSPEGKKRVLPPDYPVIRPQTTGGNRRGEEKHAVHSSNSALSKTRKLQNAHLNPQPQPAKKTSPSLINKNVSPLSKSKSFQTNKHVEVPLAWTPHSTWLNRMISSSSSSSNCASEIPVNSQPSHSVPRQQPAVTPSSNLMRPPINSPLISNRSQAASTSHPMPGQQLSSSTLGLSSSPSSSNRASGIPVYASPSHSVPRQQPAVTPSSNLMRPSTSSLTSNSSRATSTSHPMPGQQLSPPSTLGLSSSASSSNRASGIPVYASSSHSVPRQQPAVTPSNLMRPSTSSLTSNSSRATSTSHPMPRQQPSMTPSPNQGRPLVVSSLTAHPTSIRHTYPPTSHSQQAPRPFGTAPPSQSLTPADSPPILNLPSAREAHSSTTHSASQRPVTGKSSSTGPRSAIPVRAPQTKTKARPQESTSFRKSGIHSNPYQHPLSPSSGPVKT